MSRMTCQGTATRNEVDWIRPSGGQWAATKERGGKCADKYRASGPIYAHCGLYVSVYAAR